MTPNSEKTTSVNDHGPFIMRECKLWNEPLCLERLGGELCQSVHQPETTIQEKCNHLERQRSEVHKLLT